MCWYHEAVCVHVRMQERKDGAPPGKLVEKIERWLLDPSMGDRPLTLEEWRRPMRGAGGAAVETFVLPRFAFGLSDRDNPPSSYKDADLADALAWCRDGWRASQRSYEDMGFYTGEAHKLAGLRD